ncbi:MAG: coenzyme F430 synthase [Methanomicrobiales archaeon]
MNILVLDTIHGGDELARALRPFADRVDAVDVYRCRSEVTPAEARARSYDLVIAPVHLVPTYPLIRQGPRVISHHDAVRWVLEGRTPSPLVEITGARGKTTTAHALAHLMPGEGVLHTSQGTRHVPDGTVLWHRSITPASLIDAAICASERGWWCIAEESLGVTGAGDLAILTSTGDYPIAGGKRRALDVKLESLRHADRILTPPGCDGVQGAVTIDQVAAVDGSTCTCAWDHEYLIENPLFLQDAYRLPLMFAAGAACMLGLDPTPLSGFRALPGRLSVHHDEGVLVVDNANSGACASTAMEAATVARNTGFSGPLTLVIGADAPTVCEGFSAGDIAAAVDRIHPDQVVLVGPERPTLPVPVLPASSFAEGARIARETTTKGCIVLSVKTWR